MNHRLEYQLRKVERVLPLLTRHHVPVYRIELDVQRPAPRLHTGAGPYDWIIIGFGLDDRGPWTDYSAWLRGVELWRRARTGRHPPPCRRREVGHG